MNYINVKEVAAKLGIGESSVWSFTKSKEGFPRKHVISTRTTRWVLEEVEEYMRSCRVA